MGVSDLISCFGISSRTLQRVLPTLTEENLIIRERQSGNAYRYAINIV